MREEGSTSSCLLIFIVSQFLVSSVIENQDVRKNNVEKAEVDFSDSVRISFFAVVCNSKA